MNSNQPLITRRRALRLTLALAGTALAQPISSLLTDEIIHPPTPENRLGPFYPVIKPLEKNADLTTLRGHKRRAEGKIIHLMGRVLDLKGEPVKGARIEIWPANTHGRYAHAMDTNPAPLDPNPTPAARRQIHSQGRPRVGKEAIPATGSHGDGIDVGGGDVGTAGISPDKRSAVIGLGPRPAAKARFVTKLLLPPGMMAYCELAPALLKLPPPMVL